ncbi:probable amidase At4g34880 [Vitis vinifera]|uniref:probable amidase At4g34880 n=1 Tax=Vitis vinifera TaxID=29760 RepID=UPI002883338D|nr:probable amidase At4g34880 [Vitis vinifera]
MDYCVIPSYEGYKLMHYISFVSLQEKTDEYGQEVFMASEMTNGIGEEERTTMEMLAILSRDGFEKLMKENELDATVTLGPGMAPVLTIGGYPGITVRAGYDEDGMPFGICFGGLRGMEPKLIEVAYGFEQPTMIRRPPA